MLVIIISIVVMITIIIMMMMIIIIRAFPGPRRSLFKPAAFFKGIVPPLRQRKGKCS